MRNFLGLCALAFCATAASGAIILDMPEGIAGAPAVGGSTNQYLGVSWSSTIEYTNVTIRARIWSNGQPNQGTAWLTQQIGPSAQPGSEYASAAITFPAWPGDYVTLFSGVDLAPGTWHVVLSAPVSDDPATMAWVNGNNNPTLGDGVTYIKTNLTAAQFANTSFAPGSTWGTYPSLAITMRGTPGDASIPEPATIAIAGVGLIVIGLFRKR